MPYLLKTSLTSVLWRLCRSLSSACSCCSWWFRPIRSWRINDSTSICISWVTIEVLSYLVGRGGILPPTRFFYSLCSALFSIFMLSGAFLWLSSLCLSWAILLPIDCFLYSLLFLLSKLLETVRGGCAILPSSALFLVKAVVVVFAWTFYTLLLLARHSWIIFVSLVFRTAFILMSSLLSFFISSSMTYKSPWGWIMLADICGFFCFNYSISSLRARLGLFRDEQLENKSYASCSSSMAQFIIFPSFFLLNSLIVSTSFYSGLLFFGASFDLLFYYCSLVVFWGNCSPTTTDS